MSRLLRIAPVLAFAAVVFCQPLSGRCYGSPVPEYTIAQVFTLAKRAKDVKFAKVFDDHAIITSSSYRVPGEKIGFYYFHAEYGPQIRKLLKEDYIVNFQDIDIFLRKNINNIQRVSFYPEGFISLQMHKPQYVMLIPVSLTTVRKSEQVLKSYLKMER